MRLIIALNLITVSTGLEGNSLRYSIIRRAVSVCAALSLAFLLGFVPSGLAQPALAAPAPDLIIPDISLSPIHPAIGDSVTITLTVRNQGDALAFGSSAVCYIDDAILATNSIGSLEAGSMATTTFTWKALAGSHIIRAVADSAGAVPESDETNNSMTFSMTSLAADLIVQSISWLPANPSKGDDLIFRITVKNQGNNKSGLARLSFYIDGNSRGYRDVYPIDPGSTSVSTYNWVAQSGQHALKAVIDEAGQLEEGNESNNVYNMTFSTLPPDLIVHDVVWEPENPSKNDTVTFTANITNQGTGRSDSCQLAYYIDGVYRSALQFNPLEAGSSDNITFTWTALSDLHEIKVVIDYNDLVAESDENNNQYVVNFQTLLPDLIVEAIGWVPEDAGVGDTVSFNATIKNQGSGRAEASRLGCYISGSFSGYVDIGEVEPDATAIISFEWKAVSGDFIVKIVADSEKRVVESNENNNTTTRTISIIPPDIFIPAITWLPENPPIGDLVTFTANLTNLGGGAAGGFYIAYYVDDEFLALSYVSGIISGDNVTSGCDWIATSGRHTFKAVADYNFVVFESNENNNERSVAVTPLMPDVSVGTVTWSPADITVGGKTTFAIKIENRGTLNAGPSRVAYYIDGVIAGYNDIDLIEAGAFVTKYLPWTVAIGAHSITIVADASDQVFELDENNTKVVNIPMPDLLVTGISFSPAEAAIGDEVTVTATLKNQGAGASVPALATFYIDAEPVESRDFAEINPDGSASVSFTWTALAGDHDVTILADGGNAVTEVDETNNEKETVFATLTPDLVVDVIDWSMEDPLVSDAVAVDMTVKNRGTDVAGEFHLSYTIDGDDPVNVDMAPIPAGGSFTLHISPRLTIGTHIVTVTVDTGEDVIELDETNNEKSIGFSTVAPDLVVKSISWPTRIAAGEDVTITVNVANQGTDKVVSSRLDLFINGELLGSLDIDVLEVGASLTGEFSWSAVPGELDISAYADMDGLLLESNEGNNSKSRTISLDEPPAAEDEEEEEPVIDLSNDSSDDKGFMASYWWLLMMGAVVLGGGAFVLAYKSFRKD